MITIEQLKDIKERTEALNRYLDIEGKKIQVEEEQLRTQAPGFWDDQKAAEAQMKKVKGLQQWISGYNEVKVMADELQLAFDFYKDELVTEEEVDEAYAKASAAVEALELKNMLRDEADQMDCVLKINSGAGGTESQDWASMLMRMYLRYAETHGYKATISNLQEGDEAGIKTCTIEISGDYAYGYLKGENGVHRLVRVSPYNAQGKRMTSFASVFVTPLVDDTIEVNIEQARISWDTFRSSGAGGLFTGFFLLAAGIVAIAARKTKGGTIASIILYALAAIFAFANMSENFGDLVVWAVLSVIFAVVLVITLFLKEKDSSDETTKE